MMQHTLYSVQQKDTQHTRSCIMSGLVDGIG